MANSGRRITTRSLKVQRSSRTVPQSSPLARPAPFDKLAAETIEQIFISACPTVSLPGRKPGMPTTQHQLKSWNTPADPLILSMVCRRWYDIMKAHHSLWRTIHVLVYQITPADWNLWGLLQLRDRLNRSGAQPLQIRVDDGHFDDTETLGILEVIMLHAERWKNVELDFRLECDSFLKLNSLKGRLPRLESLYVRISGHSAISRANFDGVAFLSAPLLTRVHFMFSALPMSIRRIIPWAHLSEAVFDSTSFGYKRDLRYICECLSGSVTTLSFMGASFYDEPEGTSFTKTEKPIKLGNLRRLCLHSDCYVGLLNVFICPSLTWLDVEDTEEDQLIHFLNNSSCALTHIHLFDIRVHDNKEECYRTFHNPASSTLKSISLRYFSDLLVFDSHKRFPCLDTLFLHVDLSYDDVVTECLPPLIENLREFVKSRTQATSSNCHESAIPILDPQVSNFTQNNGRSLLKYCFITIDLDTEYLQRGGGYRQVMAQLETLHSFFLSRNVCGQVEVPD